MTISGRRTGRRWLVGMALASLSLLGVFTVQAQVSAEVTIFDEDPGGLTASIWGAASNEGEDISRALGLEQIAIDSCGAVAFDESDSPVLIVAESYQVQVIVDDTATTLEQGESTRVPAGQEFSLSNTMVDPAYRASALLLYGVSDDEPLARSTLDADALDVFGDDESFCSEVSSNTETTLFVIGTGAADGDVLYVGSALWAPGATTEGLGITQAGISFNAVIISGGMSNAGFGTGRAFHAGPYRADLGPHQAMSDAYSDQPGGLSSPYANPGAAPVYALIFGVALLDEPVFQPITS